MEAKAIEYSELIRQGVHYLLHLFLPALVAWLFFRAGWKKAWILMLITMIVDLDHLLANPVFDPGRCSIGYHPLHSWYAIGGYGAMVFVSKIRIVAAGLLVHMVTDLIDCFWINLLDGTA
mgnify:CR=1 FL=1